MPWYTTTKNRSISFNSFHLRLYLKFFFKAALQYQEVCLNLWAHESSVANVSPTLSCCESMNFELCTSLKAELIWNLKVLKPVLQQHFLDQPVDGISLDLKAKWFQHGKKHSPPSLTLTSWVDQRSNPPGIFVAVSYSKLFVGTTKELICWGLL